MWQALAMLLPTQVHARADLIAHDLVHWQEVDHHHHDDLSLHVDDSEAQTSHDHSHDGVQPSGILPPLALFAADPLASGRLFLTDLEPPPVFLRAPLRPPQLLV